jgi:hypothetical protein
VWQNKPGLCCVPLHSVDLEEAAFSIHQSPPQGNPAHWKRVCEGDSSPKACAAGQLHSGVLIASLNERRIISPLR